MRSLRGSLRFISRRFVESVRLSDESSGKRFTSEPAFLLWRDGFVPEWVDLMVVGLADTLG
jgi:hypothetical protein